MNGFSGSGTLFTGNIAVNAGTLRLGSSSGYLGNTAQVAGTSTIIVGNGATLDVVIPGIVNASGTAMALSNALILNGTGISSGGALQNSSPYTVYLTGPVTLASNSSIVTSGTGGLILSGSITDNTVGYGLTVGGNGTLFLTGTSNYTGGTTITSGALQLGLGGSTGSVIGNIVDNASLVFNRADAPFYSGTISGTGNVTLAGTGTLTLNGANTYSGVTTVTSGGTLSVGPGSLGNTSSVVVGTTVTSTLNLYADNAGAPVTLAPGATMTLGGANSEARLGFQLGTPSAYDELILTANGGTAARSPWAPREHWWRSRSFQLHRSGGGRLATPTR